MNRENPLSSAEQATQDMQREIDRQAVLITEQADTIRALSTQIASLRETGITASQGSSQMPPSTCDCDDCYAGEADRVMAERYAGADPAQRLQAAWETGFREGRQGALGTAF